MGFSQYFYPWSQQEHGFWATPLSISLASIQNLRRFYPMPGLVPGPGDTVVDKTDTVPVFRDSQTSETGAKPIINYNCVRF